LNEYLVIIDIKKNSWGNFSPFNWKFKNDRVHPCRLVYEESFLSNDEERFLSNEMRKGFYQMMSKCFYQMMRKGFYQMMGKGFYQTRKGFSRMRKD
jgi:hypothetical protein